MVKRITSSAILNPSRRIPVLDKFLGKLFSTKNKRRMKKLAVKVNRADLKRSYTNYFNCANLIISTKLLLIWEQETFKLLQHLHFASGYGRIQPLDQITSLTKTNGFFRLIGYGKLLDNLPFLEEIANGYKKHSDIAQVAEKFFSTLQQIEELNEICSPQTLESDRPISPATNKRFSIEGAVLFQVITFGHFDKSLLFPMQKVAISVFNQLNGDREIEWIHLYSELVYKIKDLPEVIEFKKKFLSSDSKEKIVSDIFYPEMDPHFYEMKVVDLEKCRHCKWRFCPN
jgi:hypothetical protein